MGSITFTDDVGAATLTNGKSGYLARFANWIPMKTPIGDTAFRLSDEALTIVRTSWRYSATFDLEYIPLATVSGVRMVSVAARLIAHLRNGGQCSVATGDSSSNVYATCGLTRGGQCSLTLVDRRTMEYRLSLDLTNQAGSPVLMECFYSATVGT